MTNKKHIKPLPFPVSVRNGTHKIGYTQVSIKILIDIMLENIEI